MSNTGRETFDVPNQFDLIDALSILTVARKQCLVDPIVPMTAYHTIANACTHVAMQVDPMVNYAIVVAVTYAFDQMAWTRYMEGGKK